MRTAVYLTLALLALGVVSIWITVTHSSLPETAASSYLECAGVIVAGAAASQIVFAVLAYFESAVLRNQLEDARRKLSEMRDQMERQNAEFKLAYYHCAKAGVETMLYAVFTQGKSNTFAKQIKRIKHTQLRIELARESVDGYLSALEIGFKLGSAEFFDVEEHVLRSVHRLSEDGQKVVLQCHQELKRRMLAAMSQPVTSSHSL